MAGYTLSALETNIRNYTEVDSNVLTGAILGGFIENAEFRIFYDVPIDAYRYVSEGNLAIDDNTINVPGLGTKGHTGTVFVRGVEVFNSTSVTTGPGEWLIKKDQTYLTEYVNRETVLQEAKQVRMLQVFLSIMRCLGVLQALHQLLLEVFI